MAADRTLPASEPIALETQPASPRTTRIPSPMDDTEPDRKFASTLARGLSVLAAFRTQDGPLGNQEIARRTGLAKSTISRLTYTLTRLGYLDHLPNLEKYRLGPAVLALGNVAFANLSFLDLASVEFQRLANESRTLVALTVRSGLDMLYVHVWRPETRASIWVEPGRAIPIHCTACGLALLAALPEAETRDLVDQIVAERGVERDGLWSDIAAARQSLTTPGYIENIGRWVRTINAVAVPYRAREFSTLFVFNCGAEASSLPPEMLSDVGTQLRSSVSNLERAIGRHG